MVKKVFEILNKDFLIREYILKNKSSLKIAKETKCLKSSVLYYLHKYGLIDGHKKSCNCTCCKIKRGEMIGENALHYTGGRHVTHGGYIKLYKPDRPHKIILEHRFKMENKLGRRLKKDEWVHHKNGDKQDNRLRNLSLVSKEKHNKIHKHRLGTGRRDK